MLLQQFGVLPNVTAKSNSSVMQETAALREAERTKLFITLAGPEEVSTPKSEPCVWAKGMVIQSLRQEKGKLNTGCYLQVIAYNPEHLAGARRQGAKQLSRKRGTARYRNCYDLEVKRQNKARP